MNNSNSRFSSKVLGRWSHLGLRHGGKACFSLKHDKLGIVYIISACVYTVGPLLSGHLLSGHPKLSGHFYKVSNYISLNCCILYLYLTATSIKLPPSIMRPVSKVSNYLSLWYTQQNYWSRIGREQYNQFQIVLSRHGDTKFSEINPKSS